MKPPKLDNLLLTEEEVQLAREQIQLAAYFKWQDAGCPDCQEQFFWREAELEWVEYFYVPDRYPAANKSDVTRDTRRKQVVKRDGITTKLIQPSP